MNLSVFKATIVFCALSYSGVVSAASLDNVQFIKISAKEEKAVVKMPDGKLQLIKPGDVIGGNVTVQEIAPGRVVLEEITDKGLDTIVVRMANDKATIERMQKLPGKKPTMLAPAKNKE